MHGQLCHADIHRAHRGLGVGNVAQGGAAGHVRPVGVVLHRHIGAAADLCEHGGGEIVGGVAGGVLDDHAAAQHGRLVGVGHFRAVGVTGMSVVAGEQKGVIQQGAEIGTCLRCDSAQHVIQRHRGSSLFGLRADFLVIGDVQHLHGVGGLRIQKSLGAGECACQIVQPGGGEEFLRRTPDKAVLVVVDDEICGKDVLLRAACQLRNLRVELPGGGCQTVERGQIPDGIVLIAVIGLPVHVDSQTGDDHHVFFKVHQFRAHARFRPKRHASGNAEGAVQPAVLQHTAVPLGGKSHAVAAFELCLVPDAEAGGVGMAGGDHKGGGLVFRQTESDKGAAVGRNEVPSACGHCSVPAQGDKACREQFLPQGFHSVIGGGAFLQIVQQ